MANHTINTEQGHWLLSKVGKKVLRPGGKALTLKMLTELNISPQDDVVEFAPGIGFTAAVVLKKKPASYTGIELNEEAAANLKKKINGPRQRIVVGNAAAVPLDSEIADKLYGEAMLTMHVDKRKSEIIKEAYRLLRPGGRYAIHELGLTPDNLDRAAKDAIQRGLAQSIRVNARPLTQQEWITLLESEGFKIQSVATNSMSLLAVRRVINDEGLFNALRIGYNIWKNPDAKKRILEMRRVFQRYKKSMNAVAIIAKK